MSAEEVLAIYKSQRVVEEGFRALYHSKDVRIETHTVMVVLGYLLMPLLRAILVTQASTPEALREGIKHSFGMLSETIRCRVEPIAHLFSGVIAPRLL